MFFTLAPMLSIIPAMVTFAVIPFAAPLPTPWGVVPMMIADLPVGILFLLAFSSLGVYGIVMAGWASSNKYALLGGLRAGAQMISYEIALGLSLMSVFFLVGNVGLDEIVYTQQRMNLWFALPLSRLVLLLLDQRLRRDQPPAVRPSRGGERAGDRLPHRVQRDEVQHVLHRRVRARAHGERRCMATLFLGGWDIPGLRRRRHAGLRERRVGGRARRPCGSPCCRCSRSWPRPSSSSWSSCWCAGPCRGSATTR